MSLNSPLGATQSGTVELRQRAAAVPHSRTRAGKLALGVLLVTVTIVATSAAKTDLLLPESVRPVPGWLAGVFGNAGLHMGPAALVPVLAVMFAAYAVAVKCAGRLSTRAVIAAIAAMHALVLLAPPLLSTDVFSYESYARMFALYGANPYTHGPQAFALDPVYPFIGAKWIGTPTAYGPVFTALSAALAPLSIAAGVLAYKGLAAVASIAIVAVVWDVARRRGINHVKAAALVGLNPLIVVYGVGGGHNDLLMAAAMMGALWLVLAHRERASGVAMAIAAGIKLTGAVLAPFALAGLSGPLAPRRRRELVVGGAAASVAVGALAFGMFGGGSLEMFATLHTSQNQGDWHSIPGFITSRLGLGVGHVTGYVLAVVFLAVFVWLLRRVWRREMDWIDGAAWTSAALLASASSLLPWYVAWLMPLAALGRDRRLMRVAIIMTGVVTVILLIGYIPNGGAFKL
jgi:alpha-1,6-mannosyltransferase